MPNNFDPAMVKRSIIKFEQIMFTRTLNKNKLILMNNDGHTSNTFARKYLRASLPK